ALDGGVAHHPAFADTLATGLELRLDERDEFGALSSECERRRQHRCEADEARIASDDIDVLGNVLAGQVARLQPFVDNDARVLAELPRELAVPDIDGVDALGAL